MAAFLQSTLSGLSTGAIYTLLGLGFVIIYKATEVVSFAQPSLLLLGAYFASYFAFTLGLNFFVALIVAIAIGALLGAVIERVALRPMVGEPVFAAVMVTIGVDIILRVIGGDLIGIDIRQVGDPWDGVVTRVGVGDGRVSIFEFDIAVIAITAAVVTVLLLFFKFSRVGLAMRATAFDQEAALAHGVPVGRMFGLSWILAGGLSTLAGVFVGSQGAGIDQGTAFVALRALPAIILGGLDSIPGAVVGGLVIGLAESYTGRYQPDWLGANFNQVVPYLVMLLVLLVRPYGLFGTRQVERV